MEYKSKSIFFGSSATGGHMQMSELIDYPGVQVVAEKDTPDSEWQRKVFFNNQQFDNIADAVRAWHLTYDIEGKN